MQLNEAKTKFGTKKLANEGVRLYLVDPATGLKTEHWLTVLGTDSQAFRSTKVTGQRAIAGKDWSKNEEGREKAIQEHRMDLTTCIVTGWSFEDTFTKDALKEFFDESPGVAEQVDIFASDRSNFIVSGSQS